MSKFVGIFQTRDAAEAAKKKRKDSKWCRIRESNGFFILTLEV